MIDKVFLRERCEIQFLCIEMVFFFLFLLHDVVDVDNERELKLVFSINTSLLGATF